jgi:DNA polymerase-1
MVPILQERLEGTHLYVLDVETHKTDTFDNKVLLGVAIGIPSGFDLDTYYVPPDLFHHFHDVLRNREMVGFQLGFDLEICEQNGLTHTGFVWDVLVMMHLCNENEFQYSLDALSMKYLKANKGIEWNNHTMQIKKIEEIYGWNDIPIEFMSKYAEQDIQLTWQLYIRARAELEKQKLTKVYMSASKYVKSLQHMAQTGLLIDWNKLASRSKETQKKMADLDSFIGFDPNKRGQLTKHLYTKLGLPCLAFTKGGAPSVDSDTLELLAERRPEHKEFLDAVVEYRKLQKMESTWHEGFLRRRTADDRIHPGFKQHGTVTGRLSQAEPNLQQLPRDSDRGKDLFIDPEGYYLVEWDYAAVELRVGAYYAMKLGDDKMYKLFMEELDVHAATAHAIGAFAQGLKEARQVGKTGNFAWIYGAGAKTIQSQLRRQFSFHCELEQASEWTERFHDTYPGFRAVTKFYAGFHARRGYVEAFNKRRFRITEVNKRDGKIKHYTAFNRVDQGGCGQVLMYTTNSLSKKIKDGELNGIKLCNSVHDSIWAYVKPECLDEVTQQVIDIMKEVPEKVFEMDFPVEPKLLNHKQTIWEQGKWQVPPTDKQSLSKSPSQPAELLLIQ